MSLNESWESAEQPPPSVTFCVAPTDSAITNWLGHKGLECLVAPSFPSPSVQADILWEASTAMTVEISMCVRVCTSLPRCPCPPHPAMLECASQHNTRRQLETKQAAVPHLCELASRVSMSGIWWKHSTFIKTQLDIPLLYTRSSQTQVLYY